MYLRNPGRFTHASVRVDQIQHYARICRIGQAVHRKELEPEASWTSLAFATGYSDQSHFIRDFKALTGILPSDFQRGQSPILRYPKWDE
jgi:AraC-like DNA-binding protein